MNRTFQITGIATLALLAAASVGCRTAPDPADGPFILITVDTTRADRIGIYGGQAVPTPAFDRLGHEGITIEQGVSQVPLTLPAHSSLFTGRYPLSHGVRHNGIYRLPESAETIAERFRDAGWRTGGVVSAYVLNKGYGAEQGFDHYDDVPVNRYAAGQDQLFLAERPASAVNRAAIEWLADQPDDRFFLWLHYYDPHDPYEPPEDEGLTLHGSGYDREISYLDSKLGELWKVLKDRGSWDNATIMLTGDHGESLGEHQEITHGLFLYEGAMHIPMLVKSPGLPQGERLSGPVELVDLAPTLLELAGLPALGEAQGVSLLPRIRGDEDGRLEVAYAESLMPRLEFGWSELWMLRDTQFKYIEAPTPELYDLHVDPGELENIAAFETDRVAEMSGMLKRWKDSQSDGGAAVEAERSISAEEEAKLRSLGYLGGDAYKAGQDGEMLPDPKDMIGELRALDRARELLDRGDASGALEGVDAILANSPGNHQARTTRVLALIAQENWLAAEDEAMAALAGASEDAAAGPVLVRKARGLLASVYQLAGKRTLAEAQYVAILESDPAQTAAAVDLARLYLDLGRFNEADRWLRHALELDPKDSMAWGATLRLAERMKDDIRVLEASRMLAASGGGAADELVAAGRRLSREGESRAAVKCYEAALEQQDTLRADWVGELGAARMNAGDLSGAEEAFSAYAGLRPRDPRPWGFLTQIALARGDSVRAEAMTREALARDRGFVPPLLDRARAALAGGDEDAARKLFQEAMQRNRRHSLSDPLADRLR